MNEQEILEIVNAVAAEDREAFEIAVIENLCLLC